MQFVFSADHSSPQFNPATHFSDFRAREVENKDIVEVLFDPADEDSQVRRISLTSFDSRKYNLKKTWLTVFQAEKMLKLLCAVHQKQEDKLMAF